MCDKNAAYQYWLLWHTLRIIQSLNFQFPLRFTRGQFTIWSRFRHLVRCLADGCNLVPKPVFIWMCVYQMCTTYVIDHVYTEKIAVHIKFIIRSKNEKNNMRLGKKIKTNVVPVCWFFTMHCYKWFNGSDLDCYQ